MSKKIISEYMALIGRKGGQKTAKILGKKHFSAIGKIGRQKQLEKLSTDKTLDKPIA